MNDLSPIGRKPDSKSKQNPKVWFLYSISALSHSSDCTHISTNNNIMIVINCAVALRPYVCSLYGRRRSLLICRITYLSPFVGILFGYCSHLQGHNNAPYTIANLRPPPESGADRNRGCHDLNLPGDLATSAAANGHADMLRYLTSIGMGPVEINEFWCGFSKEFTAEVQAAID